MARLLTVDEAADAGWGHRASLYSAIKKGRIASLARWPTMLDTSELERVYGAPMPRTDHVDELELDRLRHENRRLRRYVEDERRHGAQLRVMAEQFALTGQLPPQPSWRLWRWLRGCDENPFIIATPE